MMGLWIGLPRFTFAAIWIALCFLKQTSAEQSTTDPDVQEYCEWETFNATCAGDEVIMIHGARYGRMTVGRCVTKSYGHIGCGTDVTSDFDLQCSGKHNCVISVISLHNKRSCPKDFKSYLEAGYNCLKVFHPNTSTCPRGGIVKVTGSSGYISSAVARDTTLGSEACPFVIQVDHHQRINLSLVDFSMSIGSNHWYYSNQPPSSSCETYATIQEGRGGVNRTICGGRVRESVIFTTRGNYLEVRVPQSAANKYRFLLKYEAFGCPPLPIPSDAWSQSYGDHIVVHCNDTDEAWYLTCKGTSWVGHVGNCSATIATAPARNWDITNVLGGVTDFPIGILIVVTLGVAIGVAIGVMMLVGVLAYMKRRRRRKVRSRSNYMLKQAQVNLLDEPKPQANTDAANTDRTPMLKRERMDSAPATLTRHYLETWQRTRPLPIPRGQSDSGIDQENDGTTTTPDSPSPQIFTTFRPDFERTLLVNRQLNCPSKLGENSPGHGAIPIGVAPYYFKVDPAVAARHSQCHAGDYGTPDVLSCTLCRNNNSVQRHGTNL